MTSKSSSRLSSAFCPRLACCYIHDLPYSLVYLNSVDLFWRCHLSASDLMAGHFPAAQQRCSAVVRLHGHLKGVSRKGKHLSAFAAVAYNLNEITLPVAVEVM